MSFTKGCYVGQEVVSRMQNRGTCASAWCRRGRGAARRPEAEIKAGEADDRHGRLGRRPAALALLRLDRAAEAKAKGEALTAGGVAIALRKPGWAELALEPAKRRRRHERSQASEPSPRSCAAPGPASPTPIYARYHDEEWGVPKTDDRALFEKLVLEGFQAGLSWLTILRKRENFRRRLPRLRCRAHRPLRRQGHRPADG